MSRLRRWRFRRISRFYSQDCTCIYLDGVLVNDPACPMTGGLR